MFTPTGPSCRPRADQAQAAVQKGTCDRRKGVLQVWSVDDNDWPASYSMCSSFSNSAHVPCRSCGHASCSSGLAYGFGANVALSSRTTRHKGSGRKTSELSEIIHLTSLTRLSSSKRGWKKIATHQTFQASGPSDLGVLANQ